MGQNHIVFGHRFKNTESFAHSDRSKSAWCLFLSVVVISLKEKILGGRLERQKQFLPVALSGASCADSSGRGRKKGSHS